MKTKPGRGSVVFDILNASFMILACLTILFPFWQQIVISFSPPGEANEISLHLFTQRPMLDAYRRIFKSGDLWVAYRWTLLRTVAGTFLTILTTSMMAYPLSKRRFFCRKLWMSLVVFTMFFGGGLIPTFLLVKDLHMLNTVWALILPGMCSAWNIIIIRNFFMSLPEELEESARIDGANDARIFFRIIAPLSTPVLATVTLWTLVFQWNSWFDALIYLPNGKIKVLQLVLRNILLDASYISSMSDKVADAVGVTGQMYTPESVKAAILMCVVAPIICVYPFLQKYFVKGILIGAVKG